TMRWCARRSTSSRKMRRSTTTRSFSLPWRKANRRVADKLLPGRPAQTMSHHTVLVVEDNDMNMQLVEYLLEEGGYAIVKATSGEEALAITRNEAAPAPDLILMDIHLPGIDGLSVFRQLKTDARTQSVPI